MSFLQELHKPDILDCISHLSSDEVFTPPRVVNEMLDTLPQELFKSPDTKFLDPCSKSGVFLREIAKRLIEGLTDKIPDLEKRLDHIFKNQLFGLAITELTALLSRRSVYCSKDASGEYSVVHFDNPEGNIEYNRTYHIWFKDKCMMCGASKSEYDRGEELETHAYSFIHTDEQRNSALFKRLKEMKFDVIIGNPPYQLSDGGNGASAKPLYHLFVQQAKKLNPRYIIMIIPARWMTGGKGLESFRDNMIHDKSIVKLHDFIDSKDCFNGVDIKGGVCYFLWSKDEKKKCEIYTHSHHGVHYSERFLVEDDDDIYIRDSRMISIRNKAKQYNEASFMIKVSPLKPYGLRGDTFINPAKYNLPPLADTPFEDGYTIIGLENLKRTKKYIPKNYPIPKREGLDKYKIFVTRNYGCGEVGDIPATPVLATPGELCTETFVQLGPFDTKEEMENCYSYFKTKFFRMLVGICKQDQNASQRVYKFVPLQNFNEEWTDEKLYKKYGLTQEEIDFIESMIRPME